MGKINSASAVCAAILMTSAAAFAAPLFNVPIEERQPDGTVIKLFASGDEFGRVIHDADGYAVVRDPVTSEIVYAEKRDGRLVPTRMIAGRDDPRQSTLTPRLRDETAAARNREMFNSLPFPPPRVTPKGAIVVTGRMNSIVVFVRFSDETEFDFTTAQMDAMFNNTGGSDNTLKRYFEEASYGLFSISSTYYPPPQSGAVVSYKDSQPRSYYREYSVSNPDGYADMGARLSREMNLLSDAVDAIKAQVPPDLDVDMNNDGYVDSVVFIVRGDADGWSDLLWPHMSTLMLMSKEINGKIVAAYSFQLEKRLDTGVLAHEGYHAIGAPDLYHYSYDGIAPAGPWDVMEYDANPPQHMSSYMKFRYGNWIPSLPLIEAGGTYTLQPHHTSKEAYKIKSPHASREYFVAEYRKKSGTFEGSIPGSGLLVWRVNMHKDGTGNSNGPPDELYVFRKGGAPSKNGTPSSAALGSDVGRPAISDDTDPYAFLQDGRKGGLYISGIGSAGASIQFTICIPDCNGKVCGPDGCGGVCGRCFSSYVCTADGKCLDNCVMDGAQAGALMPLENCCASSQGRSPYVGAQAYRDAWKFDTGAAVTSPATADAAGNVYFGTATHVRALTPAGKHRWSFPTSGEVRSAPAIGSDGTVYFGDLGGKVFAVNQSGVKAWDVTADGAVHGVTLGHDGAVIFGTAAGSVYALEKSKAERWKYPAGSGVKSKVTVGADGVVYAGTDGGRLIAIKTDGNKKWDSPLDGAGSTPVISPSGWVYVTTAAGSLYLFDTDGNQKNKIALSGVLTAPAVTQDGTLAIGSDQKKILTVKPDGGAGWTFSTTYPVKAAPFVGADGIVYAADCQAGLPGSVYAINPDGVQKWKTSAGNCIPGHPSVIPGLVLAGSNDGWLYAVGDGCAPQCAGRECGPNGCGGICGSCFINNACEESVKCDEGAGRCLYTSKPDNTPCSSTDKCRLNEHCMDGECVSEGKKQCPANPPCRDGVCDGYTGECKLQDKPDDTPCVSAKQCSINDHCKSGVCISGGRKPGCIPDAGTPDGGAETDSGRPEDSGAPDAGIDGGSGGGSAGCSCSSVGA
jgi:M6 family metalloprotease-like protein